MAMHGPHAETAAVHPGKTFRVGRLGRLLLSLCVTASAQASDVSKPWLPVTPQDLMMKEVPGVPGAPAVRLYYADEIDDVEHDEFFYTRIKVLSDAGKHYGDVEIPVFSGTSIHDLEARTIHPDGSIVPFSGSSFEKTLLRGKGIKILARTFAFPEVTIGSILEYKYRLHRDDKSYPDQTWVAQDDLYTVKEHFWFRYDNRRDRVVAWVTTPGFKGVPEQKTGAFEMLTDSVPPFEKEELMPPEDTYKFQVRFFYGGSEMVSTTKYWDEYGSLLARFFDRYVGDRKEIRKSAAEVLGGETDPEKKLRKLYARAQETRNLSHERERTRQEQKKENLKKNDNVGDVLKHGYGDHDEISALLAALARAAGFDASLVMVSDRKNKLFDKDVLSVAQLDSLIVRVQIGDKTWYLDPGTRFCPFGTVRWMHTATAAMDLKRPGDLDQLPGAPYNMAATTRIGRFTLTPEGTLKGTVTVTFTGGEALEHRLSALDTDEAGRARELEEELKGHLPADTVIKLEHSKGWTEEYAPLSATFSLEIPAYASAAGKRLLLPLGLFDAGKRIRLSASTRKYPIYIPYAFGEFDRINITFPDGYSIESVPVAQETKLSYARYALTAKVAGKELLIERAFMLNGVFFNASRYPELKDFFAKVNAGDESQSVLRQAATTEPQKPN